VELLCDFPKFVKRPDRGILACPTTTTNLGENIYNKLLEKRENGPQLIGEKKKPAPKTSKGGGK